MNPNSVLRIEKLRGVGDVELSFDPDRRAYVMLGPNGIGKTKTLEALFQLLLARCESFKSPHFSYQKDLCFKQASFGKLSFGEIGFQSGDEALDQQHGVKETTPNLIDRHNLPVIYLGAQNRGYIVHKNAQTKLLGNLAERRAQYLHSVVIQMKADFASLGMNESVEEWFIKIAQSANKFQKAADNRQIEIDTVLALMNKVDNRIDSKYLQFSGDGRVFIKVDNVEKEINHLSSGYASLLKIFQTIVSGYGYFTNESNLNNIRGYVLIDEIESHLHLKWQTAIVPLLKELFPNTTFFITSHSPIVVNLLNEGEAYLLERHTDNVVRSTLIESPGNKILIDLLNATFGIDLNQLKLDQSDPKAQERGKELLRQLMHGGD